MARAGIPTLLSLDRYARLMGLNPVHFAGAFADNHWRKEGACEELWPQYSYQGDYVAGREDLAQVIADAEEDIARILGYYPAPKWIVDDQQLWPHGYKWGAQAKTRWGKVRAPGRRATTVIDAGAMVLYSDDDADGFYETATVVVTTDVTDKRQIKLYFADRDATPEWEIRPLRSVEIAGGLATITLDSWLLIKPELWEAPPSEFYRLGINITTVVNFVTHVDVYREYNDTSATAAQFSWLSQTGCEVVGTSQTVDSTFTVVDGQLGLIQPAFQAYGCCWPLPTGDVRVRPTSALLYYQAGEVDQRYLSGDTLDPLSDYWAQTIAWLATARLELPICACGPAKEVFRKYQDDRARVDRKEGLAMISFEVITNPFGTRFGEVRAWERVAKLVGNAIWSGGIL